MSKKEWKNIFAMLGTLKEKHRDVLFGMVFLSVFTGVRPFISIVLTGMLVDAARAGEEMSTLLRSAAVGVGGIFLMSVTESFIVMIFNRKLEYMQEIQGKPLNAKSMSMDYEYLEDVEVHEMRQRIEKFGGWSLLTIIISIMNKVLTAAVSVITALCVVVPMFIRSSRPLSEGFAGSWLMTVLLLAAVLLLVAGELKMGSRYNRMGADTRKHMSNQEAGSKYYLDILSGYEEQKDLRMCAQQSLYEREFEDIASGVSSVKDKMARYIMGDVFTQQSLSAVTGVLAYLFTGVLAWRGVISIGGVVTYAASILKFTEGMGNLAFRLGQLRGKAVSAEDYVKYMELGRRKYEGTIPLEKRRDGKFTIEFDHVSFRYPGSELWALRDLNLKFEIGEKMAIVGKNGSGKTTFIKLLCRLYDVTEGCIKVNGIDIRKYDYEEYCRLFAVVFQDFQIFSFPLGENVASGGDVDEARAVDALDRAGMGSRYKGLPEGLATAVGKEFEENGVSFSGGEKQKIAIARAIYRDAPFVIMDEPTAALDPESECEVYAGFDRMVGNKTAIYISHRLASCRFCRDILVFDKGQVVQRGSHEELEGQEGLYGQLWNAQAGYYA